MTSQTEPVGVPQGTREPAPRPETSRTCDCERGHNGIGLAGRPCDCQQPDPHPDDLAVDRFAVRMKAKLRRSRELKHRDGWETAGAGTLSHLLREHVAKGDPLDVAIFATMLSHLDAEIAPAMSYQVRTHEWVEACFGPEGQALQTRAQRFCEEALELVQAAGLSRDHAHQLVRYVYSRPAGELAQEVGGTALTLAALSTALGVEVQQAGEAELQRVWQKVEQIRAKQVEKDEQLGALPGGAAPDPYEEFVHRVFDACQALGPVSTPRRIGMSAALGANYGTGIPHPQEPFGVPRPQPS